MSSAMMKMMFGLADSAESEAGASGRTTVTNSSVRIIVTPGLSQSVLRHVIVTRKGLDRDTWALRSIVGQFFAAVSQRSSRFANA